MFHRTQLKFNQAGRVLTCFIIWPTATFRYTTKAENLRNKTFGIFTLHIITRKRLNDFADLYPETATALAHKAQSVGCNRR
jgi:hypothetical protein